MIEYMSLLKKVPVITLCDSAIHSLHLTPAHRFPTWTEWLWRTGLVAPWHVGSSRTRARTRVPCIGRWILNHCTTTEAPRDGF